MIGTLSATRYFVLRESRTYRRALPGIQGVTMFRQGVVYPVDLPAAANVLAGIRSFEEVDQYGNPLNPETRGRGSRVKAARAQSYTRLNKKAVPDEVLRQVRQPGPSQRRAGLEVAPSIIPAVSPRPEAAQAAQAAQASTQAAATARIAPPAAAPQEDDGAGLFATMSQPAPDAPPAPPSGDALTEALRAEVAKKPATLAAMSASGPEAAKPKGKWNHRPVDPSETGDVGSRRSGGAAPQEPQG